MMIASWFEVTVDVPAEHGDAVANFLLEAQAPGLQSEEQAGRARLTAHFVTAPPITSLRRFCRAIGCPASAADGMVVRVRQIAERDWAENWKTHFQPQTVGAHLYICAPWHATVPPGRHAVIIDPGMAFGTGQHASTRGCLQLLEDATRQRQIARAVDIGTGSGVLAIALAKLGVPEVWAVDTDPTARVIAATNATANHVDETIHVVAGLEAAPASFDLAVANLFANLLESMALRLTRALRSDALLICSGFLEADERQVAHTYAALGWSAQQRYEEGSWVTLSLQRVLSP